MSSQYLHYKQYFLEQIVLGQVDSLDIADHKQSMYEINQCKHVQHVIGFNIFQNAFDFVNDTTDGIPTLV